MTLHCDTLMFFQSGGTITDGELLVLGDMLWEADVQRFTSADLVLDIQSKTTASSSKDRALRRLGQ